MAVGLTQRPGTVNDTDKPKKPSRVEKITAALSEIEQSGAFPDCVTETPGAFLWEFYKAWVENGGLDGGKNRNSIRRMRDRWLVGDSEVKSLHPKLTGRIRISRDDAKSLISLFLGRWKFVGIKEGDWVLTPDGYAPFRCRDCRKLCDGLADAMYPKGSEHARIGLQLPVRAGDTDPRGFGNEWDEVTKLYRESDAVINFSRHRAALGETPPETMRIFWQFIKNFYETMQDRQQIFIWIIDIGSRQVEDEEAWAEFFNFEMLKAQFRSFATFDSIYDNDSSETEKSDNNIVDKELRPGIRDAFLRSLTIPAETHREKRWKWLCDRTVIIMQNLRKEEFEGLYKDEDKGIDKIRVKDIGVTTENILPTMLPYSWGRHKQLRELYGASINSVADATITAFFKRDGWNIGEKVSTQYPNDVRYFAHALSRRQVSTDNADLASVAISREIDSPGELYDEAFRIVYWAARHRLKTDDQRRDQDTDWAIAIAYLKNHGFQTFRLPEFLTIHQAPSG